MQLMLAVVTILALVASIVSIVLGAVRWGNRGCRWKWTLPLVIFLLPLCQIMDMSAASLVGRQMVLLTERAPQGVNMKG